ncbi:MAG: VOC family protein [Candidatus Binatia bacterium]
MLDHIVYTVPDVPAAIEDLAQRFGVRPALGGKHPGVGTHNALLSLSDTTYLEIIGPDPDQPPPAMSRPFDLDSNTGPRFVTWLAKATNIEQQIENARRLGYNVGAVTPMSRNLPDGTRIEWRLAIPPQPLGDWLVPILIEWRTDRHPAKTSPKGCTLVEFHGEHPQPDTIRPMLDAFGVILDIRQATAPALVAILDTPRGRLELR